MFNVITNCVIYLNQDLQPSPGYQTSLPAVFFQLVKLDVYGNVERFQGQPRSNLENLSASKMMQVPLLLVFVYHQGFRSE